MSKARDLADYISSGSVAANLYLDDSARTFYGDGLDLSIFHDGSNSYISDDATGDLILQTNGAKVGLAKADPFEWMVEANVDGAVNLYYDNATKISTASTGVHVTGNATFPDNGQVLLGDSDDLQIYHDGSNSYIREAGTGSLKVASDNTISFQDSAGTNTYLAMLGTIGVSLYSGNDIKLATGSFGVNVYDDLYAVRYTEKIVALTTGSIDCETGNVFTYTTSGNTTFTFNNPPSSGRAYGFTLKLTAGGTHTITYPASVDWAGATAPDAPASGETDVLVFMTHNGGTTWYGAQAIDAAG